MSFGRKKVFIMSSSRWAKELPVSVGGRQERFLKNSPCTAHNPAIYVYSLGSSMVRVKLHDSPTPLCAQHCVKLCDTKTNRMQGVLGV